MNNTTTVLWRTFKNYRRFLAVLTVLGFLGAICDGLGINAAVPLLSFLLNAQSAPTDTLSIYIEKFFAFVHVPFTFRYLIFFILLLFLVRAVAVTLFGYVRGWIGADFQAAESRIMFGRALRASWPYLLTQKMGTLQNVLIRDVQQETVLLDTTSQVIQSFSGFFIYLLVAVNLAPGTTLAVIVGGGVLLLAVRPFLARIQHVGADASNKEKEINKFVGEQIIGMKTLKASGQESAALAWGEKSVTTLRELQVRMGFIKAVSTSMFQPFTVAFIAVVFFISYKSPGFSAVAFIATLYLIQKMFTYLESGQSALHTLSQLVPYAASVTEYKRVFDEHREQRRDAGSKGFSFEHELIFKDVSLEYHKGEPAVRDINLTLRGGEMLALIGPSGAGKTTIADLLLRLFEPHSGSISIDGVDARDIPLNVWRSHFGYVSQDVFLFNGTIEENVRFYRDDLTQTEVEEAAKQANIYDFVTSLKEGFKTTVGDRGVMLSGGQRQRIALARALAGKPDILVLDEATSSLDTESERAIQEAIRDLHGRVAVFVIAHRLSTIEHADTIAVVEGGRIIEMGSPQELRKDTKSYFLRHS